MVGILAVCVCVFLGEGALQSWSLEGYGIKTGKG